MLLGKFWRFILCSSFWWWSYISAPFRLIYCHARWMPFRVGCNAASKSHVLPTTITDEISVQTGARFAITAKSNSTVSNMMWVSVLYVLLLLLLLKKATLKGDKRNTSLHIPRVLYIYSKLLLLWFLGISRLITVSNIVSKQVQRKLGRYKNGGERKRITKENTKITEGKILQIPKFLRNMWQLKQKKKINK